MLLQTTPHSFLVWLAGQRNFGYSGTCEGCDTYAGMADRVSYSLETMRPSSSPFSAMAPFYDALYRAKGKGYSAEADYVDRTIRQHRPEARSLLDVACGTGEHLVHLAGRYQVAGLDLAEPMLEVARRKLPGVPIHHGDMTGFRLPRRFGVITCLFASAAYLSDVAALRTAVASMAGHLERGGLLLIEPGVMPHNLAPPRASSLTATVGSTVIRRTTSAEILHQCCRAPERPTAIRITFRHTLERPGRPPRHFTEHHTVQLFSRDKYEAALSAADLDHRFDPAGPANLGLFVARRPK